MSKGVAAALALCFSLIAGATALAQDPSREAIRQWFNSLVTPAPVGGLAAGASCCGEAECAQREIRRGAAGLEAFIPEALGGPAWISIPPQVWITDEKILASRPFWQTIVCYSPVHGNICAVRGRIGG